MNKVIKFNYQDLDSKQGLMKHCELSDINLTKVHHSKIKNYVTNAIYCSSNELSEAERVLFLFLYDLKAQQRFIPGINIKQEKIAFILGKSKASISKSINNLINYNLLIKTKDRFGEYIYVLNEDIETWGIAVDIDKLSFLEETRKHLASSNKQLTEEYKNYKNMK